jgi:serine protease Do
MYTSQPEGEPKSLSSSPHNPRKLFYRSAVVAAVTLALGGAYLGTSGQAIATLPPATAAPATAFAGPPSFSDVAEQVTPAVVNITVSHEGGETRHPSIETPNFPEGMPLGELFQRFFRKGSPIPKNFQAPGEFRAQGSGFIIDPDGHVVTNNHVVEGAARVEVLMNDGTRHEARVVGRDSKTDLALLKIDAGKALPFVELGNSEQARVGDWVLAVGNPFGLGGSVSAGIISARGRDIHSGPYDDYIQIDAPINRGNSGGPLFDARGQVVGINTAIFSPSGGNVGIGFAIPASTARSVIAELRDHGQVERGWLGVQIQPVTKEIAAALGRTDGEGALVAAVLPDSPAAVAGLRAGDLILSLDGKAVKDFKDLPRMVAAISPGTEVAITLERGGNSRSLTLAVGEMPGEETAGIAPVPDGMDSEPRLGLFLAPLTPEARQEQGFREDAQGVLVTGVERGSAADRAGIESGSLLTMVGHQEVRDPADAQNRVREAIGAGDKNVLLRIEKNGQARFVALKPAVRG